MQDMAIKVNNRLKVTMFSSSGYLTLLAERQETKKYDVVVRKGNRTLVIDIKFLSFFLT